MEEKVKVAVIPCADYETDLVYHAVCRGIDSIGGIERFVNQTEKILLKPNLLSYAPPEKAVTTHPAVMEALFHILKEKGYGTVCFGDSPGHGKCIEIVEKLGMDRIAAKYGVKAVPMDEEKLVRYPEGRYAKKFYFAKEITEADACINVCKMKTHGLEKITGAVKNVYGFVCGSRKAAGHVKFPNARIFAGMLTDIHRVNDIRLHVMDGILAMEGNGPGSGDPVAMNVLLFSEDPVALDAVYCRMIDIEPESVFTCVEGVRAGIGTSDQDQIEIITWNEEKDSAEVIGVPELKERFGKPDFRVDRTGKQKNFLGKCSDFVTGFMKRPYIDESLCIRCGICVSHCPVEGKAVSFAKGKEHPPVYDYKKCIRCYCCQEMCPRSAIRVKGIHSQGKESEKHG